MVVYGQDKLDEISMCAPTTVCEFGNGEYKTYVIRPEDFGMKTAQKDALKGGTQKKMQPLQELFWRVKKESEEMRSC